MTQFLLVRSGSRPSLAAYAVKPTSHEDLLAAVAQRALDAGEPIWTIRPRGGEMDDVIRASQIALENGAAYEDTSLGALMASLVETCKCLALFMYSYPDDLPTAATLAMLHESIEAQLRDSTAMGEVYVRWRRS